MSAELRPPLAERTHATSAAREGGTWRATGGGQGAPAALGLRLLHLGGQAGEDAAVGVGAHLGPAAEAIDVLVAHRLPGQVGNVSGKIALEGERGRGELSCPDSHVQHMHEPETFSCVCGLDIVNCTTESEILRHQGA